MNCKSIFTPNKSYKTFKCKENEEDYNVEYHHVIYRKYRLNVNYFVGKITMYVQYSVLRTIQVENYPGWKRKRAMNGAADGKT